LLTKAIMEFNSNNIKESLNALKEMINENPRSPPDIWFAIGLCHFRLGNLQKAKFSFDKTVELDPENSMALISLGIIDIKSNINDYEVRDKAAKFFERAFKANPRNPLALKYLSEHYFF
jgi:RNA polymerase-associated protein CTR9